jgi:hypothetical protein
MDVGGNGSGLFKVFSHNFPCGTEENYEKVNQYSRLLGRKSSPCPSEYEAGVLTFGDVL